MLNSYIITQLINSPWMQCHQLCLKEWKLFLYYCGLSWPSVTVLSIFFYLFSLLAWMYVQYVSHPFWAQIVENMKLIKPIQIHHKMIVSEKLKKYIQKYMFMKTGTFWERARMGSNPHILVLRLEDTGQHFVRHAIFLQFSKPESCALISFTKYNFFYWLGRNCGFISDFLKISFALVRQILKLGAEDVHIFIIMKQTFFFNMGIL